MRNFYDEITSLQMDVDHATQKLYLAENGFDSAVRSIEIWREAGSPEPMTTTAYDHMVLCNDDVYEARKKVIASWKALLNYKGEEAA